MATLHSHSATDCQKNYSCNKHQSFNKYVLSNCASNLYAWDYHCSICFSSNLRSKRKKAEYAATKLRAQNMQWRLLWWTFQNILLTSCGYLVANGYTARRKAPQISACLSYFICQFGFIQAFGMITFAIWHGSREFSYTIKSANQPSDKTDSSKEGLLTWVAVPQSKKEYSQAIPLSSNTKRPHARNFLTVERSNMHISRQPANSQNLSYQNNGPKKYPHL